MNSHGEVVIVGAGIAGLCCARVLNLAGISTTVFEAGDDVGGRVRTDKLEGFLLDRGFQVLLTSYPEARKIIDMEALGLRMFAHGALIRAEGKFTALHDPFRHPTKFVEAALSSAGTMSDKLKVGSLRSELKALDPSAIWDRPETTTLEALKSRGFSEKIIERFFRPFYGGVFLDRSLQTSSRMFEFTFRMFADGDAAVPDAGMGALARHIHVRLRCNETRLRTPVDRVDANGVNLRTGQRIMARATVVATGQSAAAQLLGLPATRAWCSTTCFYFAAPRPPVDEAILVLDGDNRGPVNHLAVLTNAAKSYAPAGQHLISANVVGQQAMNEEQLLAAVRAQLTEWFGTEVAAWRHLKTYSIAHALPEQPAQSLAEARRPVRLQKGLYICGDHIDQASLNGAMESGRRAAEAVMEDFKL
ncbi:MAG TPA: NAD(P)/FAD-dependent oxidoreductase [Tepidisphaeraceae bacterium]|nr:NAD(P)/FAD-dependent oxidoreductase [Tepidisphaeraceae bacterium]